MTAKKARKARKAKAPAYADAHVGDAPAVEKMEAVDDVARVSAAYARRVERPATVNKLQAAVRKAAKAGERVTARGHSHTMGGQSVPLDGGVVVDMTLLDKVSVDQEAETVTAQAGATWCRVIEEANKAGLTPLTMQSYCSFTVGGSIGVNAHGITSDDTLAESVLSVDYVLPDGELDTCRPGDDAFGLVLGGYGLFEFHKASDARESGPLPAVRQPSTVGKLVWKWFMPTRTFRQARYAYESLMQEPLDIGGKEMTQNALMYESSEGLNRLYNPLVSVDRTHVLQEFFLPPGKVGAYLDFLATPETQDALHGSGEVQLLNITIRLVNRDRLTALPYARRDLFAFVFYFRVSRHADAQLRLRAAHLRQADFVVAAGGSFYLPYLHHYTDEQVSRCYPGMLPFVREKVRRDPERRFWNAWIDRYSTDALYELARGKK